MISVLDKGELGLVQSWGNDEMIPRAARVSFGAFDEELDDAKIAGMIRFMMSNKHGSVFEHCGATFYVKLPLFVVREWHRHRTQSYNEWSGRYSKLESEFYVPEFVRGQVGKPGAYTFERLPDGLLRDITISSIAEAGSDMFKLYEMFLDMGIAKEQARLVLPVNLYTKMYATANLRNWLGFLELRTSEHAMYEIREYANAVEGLLTETFPLTMAAWVDNGRMAP